MKERILTVECDFCGETIPSDEADSEMAERDYCVCIDCVDAARDQLDKEETK